jgi:hypothetical protein
LLSAILFGKDNYLLTQSHDCITVVLQVAEAPPGMQATILDITKVYCCSPIAPCHKPYITLFWRDCVWLDHCAPFGLTTAGNIQGELADITMEILAAHGIPYVVKWVDNFDFYTILFLLQSLLMALTYSILWT